VWVRGKEKTAGRGNCFISCRQQTCKIASRRWVLLRHTSPSHQTPRSTRCTVRKHVMLIG